MNKVLAEVVQPNGSTITLAVWKASEVDAIESLANKQRARMALSSGEAQTLELDGGAKIVFTPQ